MSVALPNRPRSTKKDLWEADPELLEHFGHRARYQTDDEIRAEIARIDHILWMAVEAEIEHSTQYLVELASERTACEQALAFRERRGYQYRDPAPRRFSRDTLDRLKTDVSLVDEVARTLKLVRRGKNHVARCPFHQPDRTPSFVVFAETQNYYCFGCHVHGDIFTWLMETEELSFPDAVREIAERCGLPLAQPDPPSVQAGLTRPHRSEAKMIPPSREGTSGTGGIIFEYRAGKVVER